MEQGHELPREQVVVAAGAGGITPLLAMAQHQYNLQTPQTIVAREIYDLHTLIFLICCLIFVVVFGAMTYSIIKHRKSVGHKAEQFHENTTVEIIWTIIPFVILIGMAVPAAKTILQMKDTSNPDLTIKATGHQWKWGYDYLKEGISFYSSLATPRELITDNTPEGKKKRPINNNSENHACDRCKKYSKSYLWTRDWSSTHPVEETAPLETLHHWKHHFIHSSRDCRAC